MTRVANVIYSGVDRKINWLHLPVPRNRTDAEYFLPLGNLRRPDDCDVYLGLLHASDGETGALQRIEAARSVLTDFGVATECGFGRRPADSLQPLMALHDQIGHFVSR